MSPSENFITEGNEKADELAKEGAMLDEGFRAQARGSTIQQEREEAYAALQHAISFHCLVEEWKDCKELKPQPEEKWSFVYTLSSLISKCIVARRVIILEQSLGLR